MVYEYLQISSTEKTDSFQSYIHVGQHVRKYVCSNYVVSAITARMRLRRPVQRVTTRPACLPSAPGNILWLSFDTRTL